MASVSHRKGDTRSVTDFHSGEPLTEHPSAEDVAAYLSGGLPPAARAVLEEHLADCRECRQLVTSARRLLRTHRVPNRLMWLVPPAAAAILAIVLLVRVPAPVPGGNEPFRSDSAGPESNLTIAVVAPPEGAVVPAGPIVFVWRAQAGEPLYRVSLGEADGRELWSGETTDTTLPVPAGVALERGRTYYWTVDALGADGRSLTSRARRFLTAP